MARRPLRAVSRPALVLAAVFGLLAVSVPSALAAATTYYVAPTGDDTANGLTLTTPFRTIQRCADVAAAGDTCEIRGGVYRETVKPASSGAAGQPITFKPYAGEAVTVSGADVVASGWTPATADDLAVNERGAPSRPA